MYQSLFNYIELYASETLTSQEKDSIKKVFIPKKYRKRQYFLQEGEVCKYFGFILKGAMRQYSVDEKGVEHIVQLLIENWWVGDRESYVNLTPSIYNIDAWEDSEVLIVTKADLFELYNQIPTMMKMARKMDDRNNIANQKRLNAAISLTAEKRYAEFAKNYPEFLQRFPQHLIASYLGITKETLSRIRKQ